MSDSPLLLPANAEGPHENETARAPQAIQCSLPHPFPSPSELATTCTDFSGEAAHRIAHKLLHGLTTAIPALQQKNPGVVCRVCARQYAKYTCPRCNVRYCSLDCYKARPRQP